MGVVSRIIPWNYPLIMAAWKIAPALIAGNSVVFKPSSIGCASIMRLAQLVKESGLPAGILNVVTTTDKDAARLLVTDKNIDMVSFTGGTQTGQEIMAPRQPDDQKGKPGIGRQILEHCFRRLRSGNGRWRDDVSDLYEPGTDVYGRLTAVIRGKAFTRSS